MSYSRLTVREYPNIDEPVVTVDTVYAGASAEIVESQVTKPLEDSLAGIEGVDVLSSISRQERSQITIRFRIERSADSAAADVRDRVSRVRRRLPDDVDEPVIAKVEADASPIIWLAFSSERHSPLEMSDFANRVVKPRLQTLPGAADARVFGERRYSMRVWLAGVARSRSAGCIRSDRPGRRGGDPATEHRAAGGADREPVARVRGGRAHRPGRYRGVRCGGGAAALDRPPTAIRCASGISAGSRSGRRTSGFRCASWASPRYRSASSSRRPRTRSISSGAWSKCCRGSPRNCPQACR